MIRVIRELVSKKLRADVRTVLICILVFLLSRVSIKGMIPFGLPAFACLYISDNERKYHINIVIYAMCVFLGIFTAAGTYMAVTVMCAMLLFMLSILLLDKLSGGASGIPYTVKTGLIMMLCSFVPYILLLSIKDADTDDMFKTFLQLVMSFIMYYVYIMVYNSIPEKRTDVYTSEELACFAVVIVAAIAGFPDIIIINISVRHIISIVMIMFFSLKGGLGTGAACGVTVGVLTCSSQSGLIVLYAFCGFLAGVLNKYRKFGVVGGFFAGNILIASMLGGRSDIVIGMYETLFATVLFITVPKKVEDFIKIPKRGKQYIVQEKTDKGRIRKREGIKIKDEAVKRLNEYACLLASLSSEFASIDTEYVNVDNSKGDKNDMRVYNSVCAYCDKRYMCWSLNYTQTRRQLLEIVSTVNNEYNACVFDNSLLENCTKAQEVLACIRSGIEISRLEKIWMSRLDECKSVLPLQMKGVSEILTRVRDDIETKTAYLYKTEKSIEDELKRYDIRVYDIAAVRSRAGKLEIRVYTDKTDDKTVDICRYVINSITGVCVNRIADTETQTDDIGECMVFAERDNICADIYALSEAAEGYSVCGDSHVAIDTLEGFSFAAISDGMGVGESAQRASRSVTKTLELFLRSGMSGTSSLSILNSLISTSTYDVFTASLDMAMIDMKNAKVSFCKLGAMPSLVISNESAQIIEVKEPPIGGGNSEFRIDMKKHISKEAEAKDSVIIMFSDGFYDAFRNRYADEKILEIIIECVRHEKSFSPKNICRELVSYALRLCDDKPSDDMTVMAIHVYQL